MNITGNFTEDTLKTLWKVNKENTELKQELQRKDNIINELKEIFKEYHKHQNRLSWYEEDYIEFIEILENKILILDKIKQLEGKNE